VQLLPDPVTIINLILCILIGMICLIGYVKIRSITPLVIGAAFFLFGISHAATLLDLKTALEQEMIVIRTLGYITICIGIYLIIREIILRVRTEEKLKAEQLGLEHRVDDRTAELRASNRELTASEEALLQANKKLSMLSSITRHDILNQLTGLRTYLELSKGQVTDPVLLGYIQKEEQAAEAIQWQIEFTRNYQNIGGQEPRWLTLPDTIHTAIGQLKPSGITINVPVDRVEVFADPLLEKVFYNLMENSLRHGEHVTCMDYAFEKTASGLNLTYTDDGVGVGAEDKKKLFQKGFGRHTGLGLFLSREILAITGIIISETGEPGTGARFEITVPKEAYRHIPKH